MKRSLTLIASVLSISAGSVIADTADHAPTKPAADAAARYDRSLEKTGPANATKGSDDGASGASTGTDPSPTQGNADGEADRPNAKSRKPK